MSILKPMTTAEKALAYEEQVLLRSQARCEKEKAEADFRFLCDRLLVPLGFQCWYAHGPTAPVAIRSLRHFGTGQERLTDAELATAQKILRKFPYSYELSGVVVRRKRKPQPEA